MTNENAGGNIPWQLLWLLGLTVFMILWFFGAIGP